MTSTEAKKFVLAFPEGRGVLGGWCILVVKLCSLGVVPPSQGSSGGVLCKEQLGEGSKTII